MPLYLKSTSVGSWSKPLVSEVTWRESMNFAASVGDNNPWYFDDTRDDGIIAPPMIAGALTWPIYTNRHYYWEGIPDWPPEIVARQVHLTETLIMHRPIRPGDVITRRGQIYAVMPSRGGTMSQCLFEGVDAHGEPVFTEYGGPFYRGVRCADEGRCAGELFEVPEAPEADTPVWEETIHIDPLAAHIYDGCTDLSFPIHTSRRFARSVGLPHPILQGSMTLTLAQRVLIDQEAAADPRRLKILHGSFKAMVHLGTDISVRLLARVPGPEGAELFFDVLNHDGKKAIEEGYLKIIP